ncbi:MAG: hypothetical protein M0011_11235, partial [Elusimicrobia bacterium]|nr:hypothetical protein [Elusimicrobiota bacterium]
MRKSTTVPSVTDNQPGDDVWRSAPGTVYNVDFRDNSSSGLDTAQYKVMTGPGQTGTLVKDWTTIAANIGAADYSMDWSLDFASLAEGAANYVSARVWDLAGATTTVSDVFYVKKDVTAPGITDNQPGDDAWRNSSSGAYNIDFADAGGSLLDKVQVKITTGPNQTGIVAADWADNITAINSSPWQTDWPLASGLWPLLQSGTNYVSVKVFDNAGNASSLNDVFYVLKDTVPPAAVSPVSPADGAARNTLAPVLDFTDSSDLPGGVYGYEVMVSTLADTSVIASSGLVTGSRFTAALSLSTTHYWKVRARDAAGNFSAYTSAYTLLVDTIAPVITDNQPGETAWRKADAGAVYNVDFADALSRLDTVQYSAWTGAGLTGTNSTGWTDIAASLNQPAYQANWAVNFALLSAGTNYISARAWDTAGSTATLSDVFTVLKDTSGPVVADNQPGDNVWRNSNSGSYDIDFADALSGLATAQYYISTGTAMTGTQIAGWTDIFTNLNAPSYTGNWPLAAGDWSLLPEGTSYVSVRVFDALAQGTTAQDVFYVRKDTTPPTVADNQADIALAQTQGDVSNINVDFNDLGGSLLNNLQYTAWSDGYMTGGEIIPWTNIAAGVSAASYTNNWSINFSALPNLAYSYISVRAYDYAGSLVTANVFSVYKNASGPAITGNQPGDDTWRNTNAAWYNVDFQSQSGTNLDKFQLRASTSSAGGPYSPGWTDIVTGIGAVSYTADWQIPASTFAVLQPGKNYISVRAFDLVPSSASFENVFYVLKDTAAPYMADNQAGDDVWRNSSGTIYNVDFFDGLSGLTTVEYRITSGPGQTGTLLKDWTVINYQASGLASYTADWPVDFAALQEWATGYVSVRAFDVPGQSTASASEVFYVLKDTTPPSVPSLVSPADGALFSTAAVAFDWSDASDTRSGILEYFLAVSTSQYFENISYSSNPANSAVQAYNLQEGKLYWKVRAKDKAGNYSAYTATSALFVDISSPSVINNQASPTAWYPADPGAVFNVDFQDLSSGLTTVEYRINSAPALGGAALKNWTQIAANLGGSGQYAADWPLDF